MTFFQKDEPVRKISKGPCGRARRSKIAQELERDGTLRELGLYR